MANRNQRRAKPKNAPKLTPEQEAQRRTEQDMLKFIKDEGIEAMVAKQVEWKANDMKARIAAASNIKAWFETVYEVLDLHEKGLIKPDSEDFDYFNNFKITLYKDIFEIYEQVTIDTFYSEKNPDFVNPFEDLWKKYENKRTTMDEALEELYAWTILEDPVLWAAGMRNLVLHHFKNEEFEEETE